METMTMMNRQEKINACQDFFDSLVMILWGTHDQMSSCNHDISSYLVPKGTEYEVTYHGKPEKSFRISDHWNWYANVKKCEDKNYIQCNSVDLPRPKRRNAKGKASEPIKAVQVAIVGSDGNYHVVYGEKFDRKTKTWRWVENDPLTIAALVS